MISWICQCYLKSKPISLKFIVFYLKQSGRPCKLFEVVSKSFDIRYVQINPINNLEPIRNLKVFSWSYQIRDIYILYYRTLTCRNNFLSVMSG